MKKTLAFLLLIFCAAAHADENNIKLVQRNSTDTANIDRLLPTPASDGLFYYNTTTNLPGYLTLGTGLSISSGVLSASTGAQADWNATSGPSQILNKPSVSAVGMTGQYGDLTGAPSLATVATTGAYSDLTGTPSIPAAQVNSDWNASSGVAQVLNKPSLATVATSGNYNDLSNKPTINAGTVTSVTAGTGLSGGTITSSGTISMPNTGTAGTYSGVTTDAQGRVTNGTTRSFSYTTRSLNTCFQPSSTRDTFVTYSVDIETTSTLSSGQVGTVYLRIYTNSSCTTGAQEISRFVNGNTQTLGLSVTMTQNVTATLTAMIPAGSYVQLVTENTTGSPTFTARPGQEVLL